MWRVGNLGFGFDLGYGKRKGSEIVNNFFFVLVSKKNYFGSVLDLEFSSARGMVFLVEGRCCFFRCEFMKYLKISRNLISFTSYIFPATKRCISAESTEFS